MLNLRKKNRGFSLVEVIIFIAIFSLFFIAAASVTITSLHMTQVNEHKILATRYAEAIMEWLKGEREADWGLFVQNIDQYTQANGSVYCGLLKTETPSWDSFQPCISLGTQTFPAGYKRQVQFDTSNPDEVLITVDVTWNEGNTTTPYDVQVKSIVTSGQ